MRRNKNFGWKIQARKRPVIRIQMKELSWANVVERDVTHTLHVTENLRKQMGRLKLPLVNIYITPFEPMGDISPFWAVNCFSK